MSGLVTRPAVSTPLETRGLTSLARSLSASPIPAVSARCWRPFPFRLLFWCRTPGIFRASAPRGAQRPSHSRACSRNRATLAQAGAGMHGCSRGRALRS
jgi:hypothetical protein